MQPSIKLTPKGLAWLRTGHLWVYQNDLAAGPTKADSGQVVRVASSTGTFLAQAFHSQKSKIALRIISFDEAPMDREFFRTLLLQARIARGDRPEGSAYRLVSAEGDLFPGLIIDVYAGHYVIQSMVPAVDRLVPMLAEVLEELFAPLTITLRSDLAVRKLEGLPPVKAMLKGEPPRAVAVTEGPLTYRADLWEGQKTGAYLDQQDNRMALGGKVRAGGRGLDAFCYQGLFALHLARTCAGVVALDASAAAIGQVQENCAANGLTNVVARKANVFEELPALEQEGQRFDVIVLDPPPFAKGRKDVDAARKGYREINRRALGLLAPGGTLATYSCSYNMSAAEFLDTLRSAAADARRQARVLAVQTQAPDHPILLAMPETHYLKGFVLRALD
jgi:23S rRNA (cytosine1962-C5)-methyltransferase